MNLDNLMHYNLMTVIDRFIPFLLICFFDFDRIHYIA